MKPRFDCTGKVTLVTGGNGGIGLGFALGVAKMGGDIAIWARNVEKNAAAKAELEAAGAGRVETYVIDVSTEAPIVAGYDRLMADFGRIDCVFANSGASPRCNSIFDMPTEHWFEFQNTALHGAFFTLREGARHMKARSEAGEPGGSLVACGSLSLFQGLAGKAEYAASKSAVAAVIRSLAAEMGQYGVRANVVAPGHEGAGEVMFVGSEVADIALGQAVIVNPMNTPSFIGSGGPEGALTEELLVRDGRLGDNLLPIPAGIPYDIAAMCEPLAVALHGVNRAEAKAGTKLVVFGCGPIGLGMVLWAVDRGCDVIALDLAEERLQRARALGARTINPAREDAVSRIKALHGSEMYFGRERASSDAYIDAAGGPAILAQVVSMAKKHARHVITAAYMKPIELPAGPMLTSEMTITTAVGYPDEFPAVVAAMPRLEQQIRSIISHHLPFAQIMEGLEIAATPQSAKVMIEFGA